MNTANPENPAAQWEAQKQTVVEQMQAGGGHPGLASPAQVQGKSGLEIMQAILSGALPYAHIAQTLDFALIEVAHGKAVFQGTPQLKHYNPLTN